MKTTFNQILSAMLALATLLANYSSAGAKQSGGLTAAPQINLANAQAPFSRGLAPGSTTGWTMETSGSVESITAVSDGWVCKAGGNVASSHYARFKFKAPEQAGLVLTTFYMKLVLELPADFYTQQKAGFRIMNTDNYTSTLNGTSVGAKDANESRTSVYINSNHSLRVIVDHETVSTKTLYVSANPLPVGTHSVELFGSLDTVAPWYLRIDGAVVASGVDMLTMGDTLPGERVATRFVAGIDGAADQDYNSMNLKVKSFQVANYDMAGLVTNPTPTAVPATATATRLPTSTATLTALPTFTASPLPPATGTPLPTATASPLPPATITALPTFTASPLPAATQTSLPVFTPTVVPASATVTSLPASTATALATATPRHKKLENNPTTTPTAVPTLPSTATQPPTSTATSLPSSTPTVQPVFSPTAAPSVPFRRLLAPGETSGWLQEISGSLEKITAVADGWICEAGGYAATTHHARFKYNLTQLTGQAPTSLYMKLVVVLPADFYTQQAAGFRLMSADNLTTLVNGTSVGASNANKSRVSIYINSNHSLRVLVEHENLSSKTLYISSAPLAVGQHTIELSGNVSAAAPWYLKIDGTVIASGTEMLAMPDTAPSERVVTRFAAGIDGAADQDVNLMNLQIKSFEIGN